MTTELLADHGHTRSDLRLVETAIRKGWQIPDQLLEALPKVAGAMALKGNPRDQIAAMKVLLAMKEQNEKPEVRLHQPMINVGVQIDNAPNAGRNLASQVLARITTGRISNAISRGDTTSDSEGNR